MTLAPAPALATGQDGRRFAWVHNRVLFVLVLAAGAGALIVKKKLDQGRAEQALWAEATDSVKRS